MEGSPVLSADPVERDRPHSALAAILTPGSRGNNQLLVGLAVLGVLVMVVSDITHVLHAWRFGVDLEIPLRATERWLEGSTPYAAEAFTSPPGPTQPFLYPPYVLPALAPLASLPRFPVQVLWVGACLLAALFALHRLAIPKLVWPLAVLWSPLLEGVMGGNVQVPVFACFVALFWKPPEGRPAFSPRERRIRDPYEPGVRIGLLATAIGAIKVSQPHAWLYVLRCRPRAALIGAAVVVAIVAATLPFTGLGLWWQWLEQLRRATDPTWELGGIAIARLVHPGVGFAVAAFAAALCYLVVPARHAGAWIGLLAVIGASSLHTFGLLFLIPPMLLVRREIALV